MDRQRDRLHRAVVELLYQQSPAAFAGALVCIVALFFGLRDSTSSAARYGWTAAALLMQGYRWLSTRRFHAEGLDAEGIRTAARSFDIGLFLTGVVWGVGGVLLFPADTFAGQIFLAFILGGMATGSIATYAAGRTAGAIFYVPALLPITARFLSGSQPQHLPTGVMMLVYAAVLAAVGRTMQVTILGALDLRLWSHDLLESARASEERYRSIVDNSLSGIMMVDDSFRITYVNGELTRIAGAPAADILNVDFREFLLPEESKWVEERYRLRQQGEAVPDRYDIHFRRPDGEVRLVEVISSVMLDRDGDRRTVAQVIDITDRKHAEEAYVLASRMEATRNLAAGIAHDFNNLLVGILGNAELLKMRPVLQTAGLEDVVRRVGVIHETATRAGDLARQLLTFARGGEHDPEPLILNEVIEETLRLQATSIRPDIVIRRELSRDLSTVDADRGRLEQVILNLCLNAAEAMPGGGTITIRTRDVEPEGGEDRAEADRTPDAWVLLEIADTGMGMSNETRQHAFEPFFTTKANGRGLGLAAVHGIILRHGGRIQIDSREAAGTAFRVYLPANRRLRSSARSGEGTVPTGDETILVVDDEPRVLDIAQALLQNLGYRVLRAEGSQDGLRVAAEDSFQIDLAILNLRMPGKGGIEMLPELRGLRPGLRVLFCSGNLEELQEAPIEPDTYQGTLAKPFTLRSLGTSVREALDRTA